VLKPPPKYYLARGMLAASHAVSTIALKKNFFHIEIIASAAAQH
jgi:hypothetical protein